jgi:CheY-like chemotaxis protein
VLVTELRQRIVHDVFDALTVGRGHRVDHRVDVDVLLLGDIRDRRRAIGKFVEELSRREVERLRRRGNLATTSRMRLSGAVAGSVVDSCAPDRAGTPSTAPTTPPVTTATTIASGANTLRRIIEAPCSPHRGVDGRIGSSSTCNLGRPWERVLRLSSAHPQEERLQWLLMGDTRVLVVDDEANITDLVATALRYEGFDVEVAASGGAAYRPPKHSAPI